MCGGFIALKIYERLSDECRFSAVQHWYFESEPSHLAGGKDVIFRRAKTEARVTMGERGVGAPRALQINLGGSKCYGPGVENRFPDDFAVR